MSLSFFERPPSSQVAALSACIYTYTYIHTHSTITSLRDDEEEEIIVHPYKNILRGVKNKRVEKHHQRARYCC